VQFNKANNHVGAYDLLVGVSVRINIAKETNTKNIGFTKVVPALVFSAAEFKVPDYWIKSTQA
jgi:hypothetical protein